MSLNDKIILITGANGGLGRAIAKMAADRGARLALAELDSEKAAAAVAALPPERQAQAEAFAADLRDEPAI